MKFGANFTKFGIEAELWFFSFQIFYPRALYNAVIFVVFLPFSKIRRKLKITRFEAQDPHNLPLINIRNTLKLVQREVNDIIPTMHAMAKHPTTFGEYKNKFMGRDVVIVGCGPSVSQYKKIEGAIHIGVNRAYKQENIKFDYLFVNERLPERMEEINNYRKQECVKFYGILANSRLDHLNGLDYVQITDTEDPKGEQAVKRNSFAKVLDNDIKEANAREFYLSSSDRKIITLQNKAEAYFAHNILQEAIGDFGGTVFSVLQFLPFTGTKKIYLVGFDVSSGYFYKGDEETYSDTSLQIYSWQYMKIMYERYYKEIELISVNPVNLKGLFKDMVQ